MSVEVKGPFLSMRFVTSNSVSLPAKKIRHDVKVTFGMETKLFPEQLLLFAFQRRGKSNAVVASPPSHHGGGADRKSCDYKSA